MHFFKLMEDGLHFIILILLQIAVDLLENNQLLSQLINLFALIFWIRLLVASTGEQILFFLDTLHTRLAF